MNEYKLIKDFKDYFNAIVIDESHCHPDELLMGPFKPLVVKIGNEPIGCVDLRKLPTTIDGFVELAYIFIYTPKKGHGSLIMKKICDLADFYELEVHLDAVPITNFDNVIPIGKLHSFYRSFGFKNSDIRGSNMMIREPNT